MVPAATRDDRNVNELSRSGRQIVACRGSGALTLRGEEPGASQNVSDEPWISCGTASGNCGEAKARALLALPIVRDTGFAAPQSSVTATATLRECLPPPSMTPRNGVTSEKSRP